MSGCASEPEPRQVVKTETIEVPVTVYVPLPDDLIDGCEVPQVPASYTVASAMSYEAALLNALEECNGDIADIRSRQPEEPTRSEIP